MRRKYQAPKVMSLGASTAQGQTGLCDTGASALGVCVGGTQPGICTNGDFVYGYCMVGRGGDDPFACSRGLNYANATGCDNGMEVLILR